MAAPIYDPAKVKAPKANLRCSVTFRLYTGSGKPCVEVVPDGVGDLSELGSSERREMLRHVASLLRVDRERVA